MSGEAGAHTPEPWTDGNEAIAVKIDRERPWASTVFRKGHDGSEANALVAMTFGGTADEAVASARRIVACVNALAGIPTDQLSTLMGEVRGVLWEVLNNPPCSDADEIALWDRARTLLAKLPVQP